MSILQFFRILWAYRLMVFGLTLAFFTAGAIVVQLVRPSYEAQSRVMLDIIKPDPVTGQVMATAFLRAYTRTQMELIKDPATARIVVDDLKLAKDREMLRKYQNSNARTDIDFSRWAAQQISTGASARLIEGSNILEITYATDHPTRAKVIADGLREAYIRTTLRSRREAARRNAEWYEEQAAKAKTVLFQAESTKSAFERANGIILGDNNMDIESVRLASLAQSGGGSYISSGGNTSSAAQLQLAQLDSELLEASKSLGPNHPQLQAMRRRRELLARQADQERNTSSASAAAAMSAARATAGMLEAQKAKVMAQREKIERLRLMQDEINLRREQYNRAVGRSAQLRQEADVSEAGVMPLGSAITPQSPVFPNKPLIIGAAAIGGFGLGILLALLLEIFRRRVRSADDLYGAVDAPVLAIIRGARRPRKGLQFPNLKPKTRLRAKAA